MRKMPVNTKFERNLEIHAEWSGFDQPDNEGMSMQKLARKHDMSPESINKLLRSTGRRLQHYFVNTSDYNGTTQL